MPRDGTIPVPRPPQPEPPRPPTREEILANIRQQNSGHLVEQVINLEADKAVLTNELTVARRRIAELERAEAERLTAMVEPSDADASAP